MVQVHPAYDANTKSWYLDTGEEASSLQELKKLLPLYTKIVGYYPKGYSQKIACQKQLCAARNSGVKTTVVAQVAQQAKTAKTDKIENTIRQQPVKRDYPDTTPYRHCKYNHNAILNLWYAGNDAPTIASELGIEKFTSVVNVVWHARQKGDPRAVERNPRLAKR